MTCQGHHDPFFGNPKLFGRAFQNTAIRLVGNKPVNVHGGEASLVYGLIHDGRNVDHGVLEDLAAFHAQVPHGLGG